MSQKKTPGKLPKGFGSHKLVRVDERKQSPPEVRGDAARQPLTGGLGEGNKVNTIVYVHGIANKPPAAVLRCQWDHALFGHSIGEKSRMVYWVNRLRHGEPSSARCSDMDTSEETSASLLHSGIRPRAEQETGSSNAMVNELVSEICPPGNRHAFSTLVSLAQRLMPPQQESTISPEVIPLPRGLRQILTRQLTWILLGDVYDYMYDEAFTKQVDLVFRRRILSGGAPFGIVAHSLGTVIAYKNLIELHREGRIQSIPIFLTLGSPLGLQEIQDRLKEMLGGDSLRAPGFINRWINVADRLDPVAADQKLANDFVADVRSIEDVSVSNADRPRHPHSATGYLQTTRVRQIILEHVGPEFHQEIRNFVIANDLSEKIEELASDSVSVGEAEKRGTLARQEVLIELSELNYLTGSLADSRKIVVDNLQQLVPNVKARVLQRYVSAELTPEEIEALSSQLGNGSIKRIWRDAEKFALMDKSIQTVHVSAAQRSYEAFGKDVHWAVLDTGINSGHPHFVSDEGPVVVASYDCTFSNELEGDNRNPPSLTSPRMAKSSDSDRFGHGTHVAGIISGGRQSGTSGLCCSMAPLTKLHSYKVLGDDGTGRDSSIIMALDHIATVNQESPVMQIHGINLSLGGGFDPQTYGCGYTPICRELYRLWRQGVMIVVSAGNSGYAVLQSNRGPLQANMDLSIGDPANLEDSIAVGSVHKSNPWTHGISFFSSRGPTADGRQKPDLVAPGERIRSANHRYDLLDSSTWYVEMSGTSMAAPHVSGILASFLSSRKEFIGRPDEVKKILLASCTSIGRNRDQQGAGIPSLLRMLEST